MKKIFSIGAAVLGAAVFFGLYQYFRTPESALDARAELVIDSKDFGSSLITDLDPGAIVQLTGQVIASESSSLELEGGVLITKSADQKQTWPEKGTYSFKAKFNGVEVDEFFGDTLYRFNDGFLLLSSNSEDLN